MRMEENYLEFPQENQQQQQILQHQPMNQNHLLYTEPKKAVGMMQVGQDIPLEIVKQELIQNTHPNIVPNVLNVTSEESQSLTTYMKNPQRVPNKEITSILSDCCNEVNTDSSDSEDESDDKKTDKTVNDVDKLSDLQKKRCVKKRNTRKMKIRNAMTNPDFKPLKSDDFNISKLGKDNTNTASMEYCFYLALYIATKFNKAGFAYKFPDINHKNYINCLWDEMLPNGFRDFVNSSTNATIFDTKNKATEAGKLITSYFNDYNALALFSSMVMQNFHMIRYVSTNVSPSIYYGNTANGKKVQLEFEKLFRLRQLKARQTQVRPYPET